MSLIYGNSRPPILGQCTGYHSQREVPDVNLQHDEISISQIMSLGTLLHSNPPLLDVKKRQQQLPDKGSEGEMTDKSTHLP